MVSIPGFMTAQRFVISEVQLRESKPLPKYLVIYKIVTDDLAAVYAEVSRRLQTGITKMSPAYDRATSISFTYRAIRPIVYHHGENAGSPHSGSQEYVQIVSATRPRLPLSSNTTPGMTESTSRRWCHHPGSSRRSASF